MQRTELNQAAYDYGVERGRYAASWVDFSDARFILSMLDAGDVHKACLFAGCDISSEETLGEVMHTLAYEAESHGRCYADFDSNLAFPNGNNWYADTYDDGVAEGIIAYLNAQGVA